MIISLFRSFAHRVGNYYRKKELARCGKDVIIGGGDYYGLARFYRIGQ